MMRRILLAGGIGSGKSTVGRLLADRGALVIDADRVGHQVLEPGGEAFEAVARRWPDVVVEGAIDRSKLAAVVFDDHDELRALEAITHPAIRLRVDSMVAQAQPDMVVLEVPLLLDFMGPGWSRVVVDVPEEVRRQRLLARGIDPEDMERRIAAQPARNAWLDWADHVIDNSGAHEALEPQIDRLLEGLSTES